MAAPITPITQWHNGAYDMIIDVRSPSEYACDHIVGAVNMPVLNDEERAEIGTLYKQVSPFEARKAGAVLIARNIAVHIKNYLGDKPASFKPLIYCWRGGQRSKSFATICSEIGWHCDLLVGGYKGYRREVLALLENLPGRFQMILISGRTGSGKTAVLGHLARQGAQVIDLEALAHHRGSLLGHVGVQPPQRLFESALVDRLRRLDENKPIFIESESARIGEIQIPSVFWHNMCSAPVINLVVGRRERAAYLLKTYPHLTHHLTQRRGDLERLTMSMTRRHGKQKTAAWAGLIAGEDWGALAVRLLEEHYDPAYDKSTARHDRPVLFEIEQADCADKTLERVAEVIYEKCEKKMRLG